MVAQRLHRGVAALDVASAGELTMPQWTDLLRRLDALHAPRTNVVREQMEG
jgi:hypothetical protein